MRARALAPIASLLFILSFGVPASADEPPSAPVAAPAPAPAPVVAAPPPPPSAAPSPRAAVAAPAPPAPRISIRTPVLPLALAVVLGASLVAWFVRDAARSVGAALAGRASAPPAPLLAAPSVEPRGEAGASAPLVPLGNGRLVYATGDGHLVVLVADPTSAELSVERVYTIGRDRERHLGDADRRQLHGFYVDDVEQVERVGLEAARAAYEAAVLRAARSPADLGLAERAADEVVRRGGADLLAADLAPPGDGAEAAIRRRASALALGAAGYRVAAVPLAALLRGAGSPDLAERVVGQLRRLTGLQLDAQRPAAAADAVEAWAKERAQAPRFERVR